MSTIIENIRDFFSKKQKGEETGLAPDGVCSICWGHTEWDGEYYEIVRDKHLLPGSDRYESFISKIADKHVNTTHKHGNKYICTSCNKEI
jgi:hypothetical protein